MATFEPKKEDKHQRAYIMIRCGPALFDAMEKAKKKTGIPAAQLGRQMLEHCLKEMGMM